MSKYVNPFLDYTFKYIFGQSSSGEFLIDFLNSLLKGTRGFEEIKSVEYLDKEQSKENEEMRGIIYDILCTSSTGKKFIVEMQNKSQTFFIDRSLVYSAKAITSQIRTDSEKCKYSLMPVHYVAFMNFGMDVLGENVITHVMLTDLDTHEPITDKLCLTFIQLPRFLKSAGECHSEIDKWIFTLKHLDIMDAMPFSSPIFKRLATRVEYANFTEEQQRLYDNALMAHWDRQNQDELIRETAIKEGRAEGELISNRKFALNLQSKGFGISEISALMDLPVDEVKALLNKSTN